jgi:hypothetical protein
MKILEENTKRYRCKCGCLFEYSVYDVFIGKDGSGTIYCPKCDKQIRIKGVM